ncbi:MAG TPA: nitroreductase family protein, partial [Thermoanaerobaculia bacterium]|nr:nitroreductase family protein [Thermoanaerobaculia bacterium]
MTDDHEARSFPSIPYRRDRMNEKAMRDASEFFLATALQRRTVRDFSPDPIPGDVVRLCLETANSAPSGANMQPWTFVVVRDPEIKRQIRIAAEKEEQENYSGRMPEGWLRALAPLQTDWRKPFLEIAPLLIVVFKQDYREHEGEIIHHYYVNESVGIACGFLLAALNAAGIATVTHTPSPMGFLREI